MPETDAGNLKQVAADGSTWALDDVGPIPAPLAAAVCQWGHQLRLALFGKCLWVGPFDFGAAGKHTVLVCEKWAGVWLGAGAPAGWEVQGVALPRIAGLLKSIG